MGDMTNPRIELLIAFPTSTRILLALKLARLQVHSRLKLLQSTEQSTILPDHTRPTAFTREMPGASQTTFSAAPSVRGDSERLSPAPQKKSLRRSVFSCCANQFFKHPFLSALTLCITLSGVIAGVAYMSPIWDTQPAYAQIPHDTSGVSSLICPLCVRTDTTHRRSRSSDMVINWISPIKHCGSNGKSCAVRNMHYRQCPFWNVYNGLGSACDRAVDIYLNRWVYNRANVCNLPTRDQQRVRNNLFIRSSQLSVGPRE